MDYITRYYMNQSILRGISTVNDVQKIEAYESKIYDRILLKNLQEYKSANIVELACGPGILLRYLKKNGFEHIVGVDIDDKYLNICNFQGLNVIKQDAVAWLKDQKKGSIDVIFAVDFFEHLNKEQFIDMLDLLRDVLSPKGVFFARIPCANSPFFGLNFYNDITHHTVFTITALNATLSMCGFKLSKVIDECPANIISNRWWRVPTSKLARFLLRKIIYHAINQEICVLGPTVWIVGNSK